MTQPQYPLRIAGNPARIEVDPSRTYYWEMRTRSQVVTGKAKDPEGAIDQMRAAVAKK